MISVGTAIKNINLSIPERAVTRKTPKKKKIIVEKKRYVTTEPKEEILSRSKAILKKLFHADTFNGIHLNKTEIELTAFYTQHIQNARDKKFKQMWVPFAEWYEEREDEQGYTQIIQRKQKKEICPKHEGRVYCNYSQQEIADKLGTTRENVCRTIASLKKKGIIEGVKYDKKIRGVRRDNTVAITLTKKYYEISNDVYFSRENAIKKHKAIKKIVSPNNLITYRNNTPNGGIINNTVNQENVSHSASLFPILSSQKKEGSTLFVRDMFDKLVWYLDEKIPDMKMTEKICQWLGALRNRYFHTMEHWESFLKAVRSSFCLMQDGFRLSLRWLLSFHIVRKILSGCFGIGKVDSNEYFVKWGSSKVAEEETAQIQKHCKALDSIESCYEPETLRQLRRELLKKYKAEAYLRDFAHVDMCLYGRTIEIKRRLGDKINYNLFCKYGRFFFEKGYILLDISVTSK